MYSLCSLSLLIPSLYFYKLQPIFALFNLAFTSECSLCHFLYFSKVKQAPCLRKPFSYPLLFYAAPVKCSQCELCSRLSNGLSSNYSNCSSYGWQFTGGKIRTITFLADSMYNGYINV